MKKQSTFISKNISASSFLLSKNISFFNDKYKIVDKQNKFTEKFVPSKRILLAIKLSVAGVAILYYFSRKSNSTVVYSNKPKMEHPNKKVQ